MEVNQKKSGIVSWQLWMKAMNIWADDETLRKPLGRWYYSGDKLERHWPSYYNFTLDSLYVRREGRVIQYRRNLLDPDKFGHSQEVAWILSEKVSPVSVSTQDGAMTWKGIYCSGITGNIVHRQPGTFTEYIAGLGEWEQELINEVKILVSLDIFISFLKEGNILIATDGSAEDSKMLFAWKTCDQKGK
eukprot:6888848-Ditylum_brightwellii.AAC.1